MSIHDHTQTIRKDYTQTIHKDHTQGLYAEVPQGEERIIKSVQLKAMRFEVGTVRFKLKTIRS